MKKLIIAATLAAATVVAPMAHAENENLTKFGDIAQIGVPLTAGAIALWKGDGEGLFQLAEGALYTAAATHALKWAVDAERPDGSANNSFPSGHTSAAAQGAAFLQMRYGWEYGLPAYAVTAVVGYSRVQADKHYWRDVAAGAVIATGVQYAVTKMGYSMTNIALAPYVNGDEVGLYASMQF
ncbi:phosphatase PAP2 family protein [Vibrio parahaemolyticus]|uniref:Phosphoesterase n=1 Tax=Vibrio fluvialis PG41 TaxID=1336752 RepID=S7JHE1_VIBFL|nr:MULTISPECIES: phosphatase PAP2 family protein [Vibrio]EPP21635.1 phosphoesterase [Vibrio fluvialis PG41]MCA2471162.1 phosphatase PAP2 family protein [Vibrio alginolyticus]MDG3410456.1 phosphatase PAP2 family protein [Vibrio parahaemolyticus]MDW2151182.1 phosphatase PAP2 family protein [Vibrio sp. 2092]